MLKDTRKGLCVIVSCPLQWQDISQDPMSCSAILLHSYTPSLTQVVLFPLPPPVVPHVGVVQSQALLSHLPHQDLGVNLDTEYKTQCILSTWEPSLEDLLYSCSHTQDHCLMINISNINPRSLTCSIGSSLSFAFPYLGQFLSVWEWPQTSHFMHLTLVTWNSDN